MTWVCQALAVFEISLKPGGEIWISTNVMFAVMFMIRRLVIQILEFRLGFCLMICLTIGRVLSAVLARISLVIWNKVFSITINAGGNSKKDAPFWSRLFFCPTKKIF